MRKLCVILFACIMLTGCKYKNDSHDIAIESPVITASEVNINEFDDPMQYAKNRLVFEEIKQNVYKISIGNGSYEYLNMNTFEMYSAIHSDENNYIPMTLNYDKKTFEIGSCKYVLDSEFQVIEDSQNLDCDFEITYVQSLYESYYSSFLNSFYSKFSDICYEIDKEREVPVRGDLKEMQKYIDLVIQYIKDNYDIDSTISLNEDL